MSTEMRTRAGTVAPAGPSSWDPERRTVELIWTTGAAVERGGQRPDRTYGPWIEELATGAENVDLRRLKAGAPVLNSHAAFDLRDVLGVVETASMERGKGKARIRFSEREDVEGIARDVAAGVIRNVSVGYSVQRFEARPTKDRDAVPVFLAARWTPLEISLVPIPADAGSTTRSAPEGTMTTATAQAAEAAVTTPNPEAERVLRIERAGAGLRVAPELIARHVAAGTPAADAVELLIAAAAARDAATAPAGPTAIQGESYDSPAAVRSAMSDALAARMGGPVPSGMAQKYRGVPVPGLVAELLRAAGERVHGYEAPGVLLKRMGGALHTTSDFVALLSNAANKALLSQYEQLRTGLVEIAHRDSARDFKTASRLRRGEFPALLEIPEHGEYTRGTIAEGSETFKVKKWGRIFGITWEAIINDDLSAFADLTGAAAQSAASLEGNLLADMLVSNPILSDGVRVFATQHGNIATTSGPPALGSLGEMTAAMRKTTGLDQATILNLTPASIVVPAALEQVAKNLTSAINPIVTSENNAQYRDLRVVVDPRLDVVSETTWYLFTSPGAAPTLTLATLEAEPGPVIESRNGWDVDGVEVKCRHVAAATFLGWRGVIQNPG